MELPLLFLFVQHLYFCHIAATVENDLNLYEVWKHTQGVTDTPGFPAHFLSSNDIIISHKGPVTGQYLKNIFMQTEDALAASETDTRLRKKIYNIVVECLQNIYQHSENEENESDSETNSSIFLVSRNRKNGNYTIYTGNFMRNIYCAPLTSRIDKINAMLPEELRAYYVESLSNTEFSEKGGAGLGIIDIAKKSGNPLKFKFDRYTDTYCFFTLVVLVTNNASNDN